MYKITEKKYASNVSYLLDTPSVVQNVIWNKINEKEGCKAYSISLRLEVGDKFISNKYNYGIERIG